MKSKWSIEYIILCHSDSPCEWSFPKFHQQLQRIYPSKQLARCEREQVLCDAKDKLRDSLRGSCWRQNIDL